jgi:proline racemase
MTLAIPKIDLSGAITTVDSHTEGNPTRVVVAGVAQIAGSTLLEKRETLQRDNDGLRRLLVHEPRGGGLMCAVVVLEPCDPRADASIIYLEQDEYPPMSGHSTIGVAMTLVKTGMVARSEGRTRVVLETPAGLVTAWVETQGETTGPVTLEMPPSFVAAEHVPIDGYPGVTADIAYGGDYYACVDAASVGLKLTRDNTEAIKRAAAGIRGSLATQRFPHPTRPYINRVYYVLFWEYVAGEKLHIRNVVICPPSVVDRSPCGTGTASLLALLHHRGSIAVGEHLTNEGILGTAFEGCIDRLDTLAGIPAVMPRVKGSAYITGFHQFLLDRRDPLPIGFVLDNQ